MKYFPKKKFCLVDGVGPFSKWASARRRWWAPHQKLVSVFWRGGQKGPPQTASITKTIFFRAVTLAQMKAPLSIQWVKKRVEDNWVSFMLRWRQKYTSKKRVEKGLKKLINQYTLSYSTDCKSTIWKQLLTTAAIHFVWWRSSCIVA